VDREQLVSSILTAGPQPGELVYVERRGDSYSWHRPGEQSEDAEQAGPQDLADAWLYYSWQRALGDPDAARAMIDDLLAEMEAMTGSGADRCRWPLDQPWPLSH